MSHPRTLPALSPLAALQAAFAAGDTSPHAVAVASAARANSNASHNTYLHFDAAKLVEQAASLQAGTPLFSVPVSLKDCFDLAGTVTSFGTKFYAQHNPVATADSAVAVRLREAGCLITGKTHLHPIAYGITGENPEFRDCVQPRDATLLTGGSSSGAAASVQEGSALAAIGTDTGGSVRVPAGLCGLVGYRASHALASESGGWPGLWRGGAHLAPSFDTLGLLFKDPRDAPALAAAIFGVPQSREATGPRIGCVAASFIESCEADVLAGYAAWKQHLASRGALLAEFDTAPWAESVELLTHIQAHEAAGLHRGHFDEFEPAIAQRLHWGASISEAQVAGFRERHRQFVADLVALFEVYDFLMLPSAPVSRLRVGADHSRTRLAILPYTAPFSLAGVPVLTLPGELIGAPFGTGVQVAAAPLRDAGLLAWAGEVGRALA